MERDIIHLNISHFMVSVEEVINPGLKNRPVLIAREGSSRAIIFDLSETAYRSGIRKGMFLHHAKKELRDAVVLAPQPDIYLKAEKAVYDVASSFSPVVEKTGKGHIFIDITGTRRLFGTPTDAAARIKDEIRERLRLDPVTANAANKLVAKIATRVVKPDGFVSVAHGDEERFLKPQQILLLPGIGKKLGYLLTSLGIESMGILAELPADHALTILGKQAEKLQMLSKGMDNSPVINTSSLNPEIVVEKLFPEDFCEKEEIRAMLFSAVEESGIELRIQNRSARKITVELEYCDGISTSGTSAFPLPVYLDRELFFHAEKILVKIHERRIRLKKITIFLKQLCEEHLQLDLFTPPRLAKEKQIQTAIDAIRKKFGLSAVSFALSHAGS